MREERTRRPTLEPPLTLPHVGCAQVPVRVVVPCRECSRRLIIVAPGCSGGGTNTTGKTDDMSPELVRDLIERTRVLEHLVDQLRSDNHKLRVALRAARQEAV